MIAPRAQPKLRAVLGHPAPEPKRTRKNAQSRTVHSPGNDGSWCSTMPSRDPHHSTNLVRMGGPRTHTSNPGAVDKRLPRLQTAERGSEWVITSSHLGSDSRRSTTPKPNANSMVVVNEVAPVAVELPFQQGVHVVNVILGGSASGRGSKRSRKEYVHEVNIWEPRHPLRP